MIINHLRYLKYVFSNSLIMTLFVDTYIKLLYHMNLVNIGMETYMQVLQKMLKMNIYLQTYM
jgi:hypothetical protein